MRKKPVILNTERDVSITPYLIRRPGVFTFLIAPGGGYSTCEESESAPVARYFNKLGYNAFVFQYSVGANKEWPHPLEDFDRAMDWLCCNAREYRVNPGRIVAIGFSAGGHVIAAAASKAIKKPFAAILCYGLIDRETLAYCNPGAPDASELVNDDTCPCFLASSRTDWIVPVTNTTKLMAAFEKHYIDYEAHIYGYAMHGFSIGRPQYGNNPVFCSRVGNWVEDSLSWLTELSEGRYISVREAASFQDAHAETLSVLTSCRLLDQCPEALNMLKHRFPLQYLMYRLARKKIGIFMDTVSLKNLYTLIHVKPETIEKLDQALKQYRL